MPPRLAAVVCALLAAGPAWAAGPLPVGDQPPPVDVPHFPDRCHAVVWRNWGLVDPARLAGVLGTTSERVAALAASMGLPAGVTVQPEWRRRGYITVLRRNWHLLPYEQILPLLDMSAEELADALREDDFLFIKLGSSKPRCPPVRYAEPDAAARARAAEIKATVERHFGDRLARPGEPAFAFVAELSRPPAGAPPRSANAGELRYLYSPFGTFGDPLADPALDPYPDGLLARYAAEGVTGVWLHVVLRQLAPGGPHFPEFGDGHERRLEALRQLVSRAGRHGLRVYLYLNEPRAMPPEFFARRPDVGGVTVGGLRSLCTSEARVRQWLEDAVAHVVRSAPGLGGVFTITASENATHCASHGRSKDCPRCGGRDPDEIIADVNATIARGVRRSSADARVIVWDWGWRGHGDAPGIIARLPKDVWLMSVSEWALPIERGGVRSTVGEYSLSAVGPGPRATRHWQLAKQAGLKTAAKVQVNITWELAAVPFLPVLDLVAEHAHKLARAGVDGTMLSWSLGGSPSPNLRVWQRLADDPDAEPRRVLDDVARERYGPAGAAHARAAWTAFSRAFAEYPYSGATVYRAPQQFGPANLLFERPTGKRSTMIGFPYDDLDGWRGPYPATVFLGQWEKLTAGWNVGITELTKAVAAAPVERRAEVEGDLRLARAAGVHFASTANQVHFALGGQGSVKRMQAVLDDEIRQARALFDLCSADSRIGFEASNHYYYVQHDLVEKVLNCEHLRGRLADRP